MTALIAQLLGVILIVSAMLAGGTLSTFFNLPSLLIVVGGALAATLIRYPLGDFIDAVKLSWRAIFPGKEATLPELIDLTEDLLRTARSKGLLAAQDTEIPNDFYDSAFQMLVDGYPEQAMEQYLLEQRHLFEEKARTAASVFKALGDAAPAFGMVGTLIGLVQMLVNLSDPSAIGPAMAVALLTTLYGALLANLIALPVADKINSWAEKEALRMELISDAIRYIQQGEHPTRVRQLLSVYLNTSGKRENSEEEAA